MSLLTAGDLTYMQDTQDTALPGSVVIERYTLIKDNMGGEYQAWAAVGTVDGRIYPQRRRSTAETIAGAQVTSEMQWWATFPEGTDVSAKDRLFYDSRTWEVVTTNKGEMWSTAVRCELISLNEERRT